MGCNNADTYSERRTAIARGKHVLENDPDAYHTGVRFCQRLPATRGSAEIISHHEISTMNEHIATGPDNMQGTVLYIF